MANQYRFVSGTPEWVKASIINASQKHNVPTEILSSLLKQESGFNPKAKSSAGATGIAQFMPATAKGYGINPLDPYQSIDAAGKYLRNSLNTFNNNMSLALASYNAGSGNVKKYGGIPPFAETRNYVKNVLSMARQSGYSPVSNESFQTEELANLPSPFSGEANPRLKDSQPFIGPVQTQAIPVSAPSPFLTPTKGPSSEQLKPRTISSFPTFQASPFTKTEETEFEQRLREEKEKKKKIPVPPIFSTGYSSYFG